MYFQPQTQTNPLNSDVTSLTRIKKTIPAGQSMTETIAQSFAENTSHPIKWKTNRYIYLGHLATVWLYQHSAMTAMPFSIMSFQSRWKLIDSLLTDTTVLVIPNCVTEDPQRESVDN